MSDWQNSAPPPESEDEDPILQRPALDEQPDAPFGQAAYGQPIPSGLPSPMAWPPTPSAGHDIPPVNAPYPQQPYYAHPYYAQPQAFPGQPQGLLQRWKAKGGVLGGIATFLLLLAKIGGPLLALLKVLPFLKVLLAAGSMFISMWVWAKATHMGWAFGIGIVMLIFIHECGHALAAKLRGIPTGIMVFIPLMGAFVTRSRLGRNIAEDAFIGIMGPVFGTLASLGCVVIYFATSSPFWLYLATLGFWINLFNLAPTAPLDGGWIVPLFSPKLLAVGVVLLILIGFRNPLIWVLGLLSLPRIIGGWKANPAENPYYQATPALRWGLGLGYFGLAVFLAIAYAVAGGYFPTYHAAI